mmetsp:Transcript_34697/g.56295  ORF Transcript_34697/g.56295 Transcript_34697/m.56295 type:complete len:533 (+) Transcript_34697:12-1610(+)
MSDSSSSPFFVLCVWGLCSTVVARAIRVTLTTTITSRSITAAARIRALKQTTLAGRHRARKLLLQSQSSETSGKMDRSQALVEKLYKVAGTKIAIATTGSGGDAIRALTQVPGMSQLVMEISVPYAKESSIEYMGGEPRKFVSEDSAIMLAKGAFERARLLTALGKCSKETVKALTSTRFVGIGCSAAVVSSRPRRGKHHGYLAAYDGSSVWTRYVSLEKGRRDRKGEDQCFAKQILQLAADVLDVKQDDDEEGVLFVPPASDDAASLKDMGIVAYKSDRKQAKHSGLQRLSAGEASTILYYASSDEDSKGVGGGGGLVLSHTHDSPLPKGTLILSGSFNPLHKGHIRLGQAAQKAVKEFDEKMTTENKDEEGESALRPVVFEISFKNPDKGEIGNEEAESRVKQFVNAVDGPWPVVLSTSSLFSEKAKLFPGCWFVVGADTAIRIVDPKYYENSKLAMYTAIMRLYDAGIRFVVGARVTSSGSLQTMATIKEAVKALDPEIWEGLSKCFIEIPESEFRLDISSTQIRQNKK